MRFYIILNGEDHILTTNSLPFIPHHFNSVPLTKTSNSASAVPTLFSATILYFPLFALLELFTVTLDSMSAVSMVMLSLTTSSLLPWYQLTDGLGCPVTVTGRLMVCPALRVCLVSNAELYLISGLPGVNKNTWKYAKYTLSARQVFI